MLDGDQTAESRDFDRAFLRHEAVNRDGWRLTMFRLNITIRQAFQAPALVAMLWDFGRYEIATQ